jgi:hypothetical protein
MATGKVRTPPTTAGRTSSALPLDTTTPFRIRHPNRAGRQGHWAFARRHARRPGDQTDGGGGRTHARRASSRTARHRASAGTDGGNGAKKLACLPVTLDHRLGRPTNTLAGIPISTSPSSPARRALPLGPRPSFVASV